MRRSLALTSALSLLLTVSLGCTDRGGDASGGSGSPPEAGELLKSAATEFGSVQTVRFEISTEGTVETLGIRAAKGVVTAAGEAQGTASIAEAGSLLELSFVVKDGTLHLKGPTGTWQQLPLSSTTTLYNPSALLSPDRGVANLLGTVTGTNKGQERVDGVDTYRVEGTLPVAALSHLVPGITADATGTLWIGTDRPVLHRARFPVPGQNGTVTVTLSEYDAPVTISVP